MAHSKKKKTVSQKMVGVATSGMPAPLRKVLGGRLVALLIVVAVPLLLATGVVSVKWENGRPKISVNQQRAAQVKEAVRHEVDHLANEYGPDARPGQSFAPSFGLQQPAQGPIPPYRPLSSFQDKWESQRR